MMSHAAMSPFFPSTAIVKEVESRNPLGSLAVLKPLDETIEASAKGSR